MTSNRTKPQFVLAAPDSATPEHAADLFGRSAAAAAIQWNCHLAITGPERFLTDLTTALRVPPERPMIIPGTRYNGALVRLATRAHRIAHDLTSRARPRRAANTRGCQQMYIEAFNEYLARSRQRPRTP